MTKTTDRPIKVAATGKPVPKKIKEDIALLCVYSVLNKIKKEGSR